MGGCFNFPLCIKDKSYDEAEHDDKNLGEQAYVVPAKLIGNE